MRIEGVESVRIKVPNVNLFMCGMDASIYIIHLSYVLLHP